MPVIPAPVIDQLLRPLGVTATSAVPPGMSGAAVFQCTSATGMYALKRWPSGVEPQRIDEIHRVMVAARQAGCKLVPNIHSCLARQSQHHFLIVDGACWELVDWMPGNPLDSDAPVELVAGGVEAIARFHQAVGRLGRKRQVAPAVEARLTRLQQLKPIINDLLRHAEVPPLPEPLGPAVLRALQRLRWQWDQVLPRLVQRLSPYASSAINTQYVLRDVHRLHILFADRQPSGLIDFDAVRVDTRAADLARWSGSFRAVQPDLWSILMADVSPERSSMGGAFEAVEIELAAALCQVNPWIGLANWLVWILAERKSFVAEPASIAERIDELLATAVMVD